MFSEWFLCGPCNFYVSLCGLCCVFYMVSVRLLYMLVCLVVSGVSLYVMFVGFLYGVHMFFGTCLYVYACVDVRFVYGFCMVRSICVFGHACMYMHALLYVLCMVSVWCV